MLMSMTTSPSTPARLDARDPRLAGWRALLTAYTLLTNRLDEELRAETGLSLFEYSALLQLAEAPGHRRRMSELADGILLTRSGVTRLIDRLERDGLVERSQCLSDGRGAEAVLTAAGLDRLRGASRVHLRGIERYYLERVSDADQATIARVMADLSEGIREPR
jgi:DNA-binding MarR family transcriptional regulator